MSDKFFAFIGRMLSWLIITIKIVNRAVKINTLTLHPFFGIILTLTNVHEWHYYRLSRAEFSE